MDDMDPNDDVDDVGAVDPLLAPPAVRLLLLLPPDTPGILTQDGSNRRFLDAGVDALLSLNTWKLPNELPLLFFLMPPLVLLRRLPDDDDNDEADDDDSVE